MFRNSEYIYTVYKEGSFSKAAEKLFIAQSSLSLTIKKAENRIGATIFNRTTNPITLTEFGNEYIKAVEKIRTITNELNNKLYDINHLHTGHISIGAATFFASCILPQVISKFTKTHPNISIDIYDSSATYLIKNLDNGSLNFLITNANLDKNIYHQYTLAHCHLILAIPENLLTHELSQEKSLTINEIKHQNLLQKKKALSLNKLKNIPFILLRSGNSSRKKCDDLFKTINFKPKINLEVDQNSTAYSLCLNGIGATIVNNKLIEKMGIPKHIKFFRLEGPSTNQSIYMYTKKNIFITRAMEEFINTLTQEFSVIK